MTVPTPRTAKAQGRSVQERLDLLEDRQWTPPPRLAGVLTPLDDANAAIGTGAFWIAAPRVDFPSGTLNSPDTSQNYVLDQYELDTTSRYQQAWRIGNPSTQIFAERWTRTRTAAGVWTPWKLISSPTKSFTPLPNFALGNGTVSGTYSVADGVVTGRILVTVGSTTAITGDIQFEHPIPFTGGTISAGMARLTDASPGLNYHALVLVNSSKVYVRPQGATTAASGYIYTREFSAAADVPFVWATGDSFVVDFSYPIV